MSSQYHEVTTFSHEDDNKPRDTSNEISLDGNHSNIDEDVGLIDSTFNESKIKLTSMNLRATTMHLKIYHQVFVIC